MTAVRRSAWIAAPILLTLWMYWSGLHCWFLQDDFAWLSLPLGIHNAHEFWKAVFQPMAQGTMRILSERLYYITLQELFGYDALPFRITAFATAFADIALLAIITRRISGSRLAGSIGAFFWMANTTMVTAMTVVSDFNHLLCAFFMLLSLWLFQLYTETGRTRYYVLQWISFVLGFGALELNVMYPALAFVYALCCARKYIWRTIPLFAGSALFALAHKLMAGSSSGVYGMHFDVSIFWTLTTYVTWALGPQRIEIIGKHHPVFEAVAAWLLFAGLVGFAAWKAYRGNYGGLFLLAWYLIVIAPLLPLRDHISDYYNELPVIGPAALGGWAVAESLRSRWVWRATGVGLAAVYLWCSVPTARAATRWHLNRSLAAKNLFWSVDRIHELHPSSIILLKNVSTDMFWSTMPDHAFRLLGLTQVYLTPGSSAKIEAHPEVLKVSEMELPAAITLRALERGKAVVYDASTFPLRNVTSSYAREAVATLQPGVPKEVLLGQRLFDDQLGSTWYPAEEGQFRWMPATATVRIGAPTSPGEKLHLSGMVPEQIVRTGPLNLSVFLAHHMIRTFTFGARDSSFDVSADLPDTAVNQRELEITLAADRTFTPPNDRRPLSIAFGRIAIE